MHSLLSVAPSQLILRSVWEIATATTQTLPRHCLCIATWPMEKMPHDDVASFCLAVPQMDYASAAAAATQ